MRIMGALLALALLVSCSPDDALPTELAEARTAELFENPAMPTDADLVLLETLVYDVASRDETIRALTSELSPGSTPIRPAFWGHEDLPGGSILIGGSFQLSLDRVAYTGPWPTTGCDGGRLNASIYEAMAMDLTSVYVMVDLNFERVVRIDVGPQPAPDQPGGDLPAAVVEFESKLADAPWYSGRCSPYRD